MPGGLSLNNSHMTWYSSLPIVLYGNLKGVLLPKHVRNNTYKSGLVEHLNMGIYPAN